MNNTTPIIDIIELKLVINEAINSYLLKLESTLLQPHELFLNNFLELFKLNTTELFSAKKTISIREHRQVLQYILMTNFHLQYSKVGEITNRDRTTILHSCTTVKNLLDISDGNISRIYNKALSLI